MKKYRFLLIAMMLFAMGLVWQLQTTTASQTVYADCPVQSTPTVQNNCIVTNYIHPAISFLSVGVGVVVLAMIIVGAIQYITSAGNPQAVAAARKRIISALLALVVYGLIFALLNFLIPGGLIGI
jgi:hypothetical protein